MTLREKQRAHNNLCALTTQMEERKADLVNGIKGLEANIQELEHILEQKRVDLIATNGALQDCDHWLKAIRNLESDEDV